MKILASRCNTLICVTRTSILGLQEQKSAKNASLKNFSGNEIMKD